MSSDILVLNSASPASHSSASSSSAGSSSPDLDKKRRVSRSGGGGGNGNGGPCDVDVETSYLQTVRGDKLHCRYWRRRSGTDDEGDIKVGLLRTGL